MRASARKLQPSRARAVSLLTLLAALALTLVVPSTASALIARLPNGQRVSYQPLDRAQAAQRAPHPDATLSNLDYSGGPVMPQNVNYVIEWQPAGYAGNPYQTTGNPAQGYVYGVAQFFKDLQAGSQAAVNTNSDSVSTQYNDSQGHAAAYSSSFSAGPGTNGVYLDSDPLPPNGCSQGAYCITDAQLQTEIQSFLSARGLPTGDLTHEYFVLTPPSVVSCFDAGGTSCSGNAADQNAQAFCAYHGQTKTGPQVLYANIPDMTGHVGCDPFGTVGECANGLACFYPNSYADGVISAISHEHNESTTDPEPNNAWTDQQQCASGAPETCGGEIGDKCNGDQDLDPNNNYQVGFDGNFGDAAPYNELINGHQYWLQMEWSNQGHTCADSVAALAGLTAAPTASFSVAGSTLANTDTFSASSSNGTVAYYVWQFNDGAGGAQQTTVESTTPTITHTFPAAGTYTVALTAMTSTGRSAGTAAQTVAAGLTQAAFNVITPIPSDRSAVTFSAAGTTHDASIGISSYSWNFGDGSAPAGGSTPSHLFRAGAHTVTLTVTDTLGRTSTTSRAFTVADMAPNAGFRTQSAKAGQKITFRGRGTDDEPIVAYHWRFGDGHTANGRNVKHAYKRKGRYRVTLTVTDADGLTGSVTHTVNIRAAKKHGG